MKLLSWDRFTIKKIRSGYYSAVYFNRTKEILLKEKKLDTVTMQIFQKNDDALLCGISHVIELLKIGTGYFENGKWISKWNTLKINALFDGDKTSKGEPVIHISGPYVFFAHLESLYLGILARETRIATNARNMVASANGKPVIFFADRFDYFLNQELDGYASQIGGVSAVCTAAQAKLIGSLPVGTIPHALIAINKGKINDAAESFRNVFPKDNLVALVDFDNDCVKTSLVAARQFGKKLWGVRLDTAENMVDKSLQKLTEQKNELHGVNPTLVKMVREALDRQNFQHVKIIVSGGFNNDKIKWFESQKSSVDTYAVGSSMLEGKNDFTADIVVVKGREIAKVGRGIKRNSRLKPIQ